MTFGYLSRMMGVVCTSFSLLAQEDTTSCTESCRCINNLTPAGVMISHVHPQKEWMLSYRFMQMGTGAMISGNDPVDDNTVFNQYLMSSDYMNMDMHMLMAMYGITNRITAMAMFHYNLNSMGMEMYASHNHNHQHGATSSSHEMEMKSNGFGDVKFSLLYGLIKRQEQQLIIGGTASIPLGSVKELGTEDDMLYEGQRIPYMMQLGSGTFDIQPNLTYTYQGGSYAFSVQSAYSIRMGLNAVGYRYGNEWSNSLWGAFNWWSNLSNSLRFEYVHQAKMVGKDPSIYAFNEPAANSINYGYRKASVYIGAVWQFKNGLLRNLGIGMEYGLPIYQEVNGIQNKSIYSLNGTLNYSF